jgi:hypothetical protein
VAATPRVALADCHQERPMRTAILVMVAVFLAASPCLAKGQHLSCPAQVSETVGGATTISKDTLQLYLDQARKRIVFETSSLRGGKLSFKTTAFSNKLISADVADRTEFGSYFDAPSESGFLRFDRIKRTLVLGMYLSPKGIAIETAICEDASKPTS